MKYLVLRKRAKSPENPFSEMVSAGGDDAFELPFAVETEDLAETDVEDLNRDPDVTDLIPSIPFKLIEPLDEPVDVPTSESVWGIDAVGARSSPYDGEGVTVAVLDTGLDTGHPAFAGFQFAADDLCDFTVDERGRSGAAPDLHGHGTHVAGTIFGRDVGGVRIGVAPGVRRALIGKVLGPAGGTTEAIFNGIEWALKRRADVISMSVGMDFPGVVTRLAELGLPLDIATSRGLDAYRSNVSLFDHLASLVNVRIARGRGALLVAASGNDSRRDQDLRFTVTTRPPAAAEGFISVGALAHDEGGSGPFSVARFSNTGCLLSAPGVGILSASLGSGTEVKSGTSMAAPHVAGVAVLWTQRLFSDHRRPHGWARDVRRAVESHVLSVPGERRDDVGLGMAQAPQ